MIHQVGDVRGAVTEKNEHKDVIMSVENVPLNE